MQKIDIDDLSEKELIELNHKIVARLRFLQQMRSHAEMLDFRIGERIKFRPAGRGELFGVITRYNRKSVTVITEDGQHWNISPSLLTKVEAPRTQHAEPAAADASGILFFGAAPKNKWASSNYVRRNKKAAAVSSGLWFVELFDGPSRKARRAS